MSKWFVLIALSGKCARKWIIYVSNLANAKLRVDNKHTCDNLVDASIKTIKYLNSLHDGCMSPHISPWIRSKNAKVSYPTLVGDGLIINLPWEQATHENSLDWKIFWFFNGWPHEFSISFASLLIQDDPTGYAKH